MRWKIPLSRPVLGKAEENACVRVLRSGRLANGPLADEFAARVAKMHGLEHGVAVSSGTLGLELALRALGVGPGDKVVCPAYTFVASANAILAVGAKPVFVDVDADGLMDRKAAGQCAVVGELKAAVVVDLFGGVASKAGELFRVAGIPVVEDACEAFGAEGVGYGDLVVFGFYPNKVITTAEGGVVCGIASVAPDAKAEIPSVWEMRNHGRACSISHGWGTNARMSELHAALGLAQLKRAKVLLRAREQVARRYHAMLPDGVRPLPLRPHGPDVRPWFVFPIWFADMARRDTVQFALFTERIQTGRYFDSIVDLPQFGEDPDKYPMAKKLSETGLALPFWPGMTRKQVETVCKVIREAL